MPARIALLGVASAALLSGCGAWQSVSDTTANAWRAVIFKRPTVLNVDLLARDALNPDDIGRATAVSVRVYQLRDRKAFDGASYADLVKNDRMILAQDLQDGMTAVLNPGASASLSQPLKADTEYVAVAAFYRNPGSGNSWKYVIAKKKLTAGKPLKLSLVDQQVVASDAVSTNTAGR